MDIDTLITIIERYGVSTAVLGLVIWGGAYVLRRLFNPNDGILTNVGERHIEFLNETVKFQEVLSKSSEVIAECTKDSKDMITDLVDQGADAGHPFATTRLVKSGMHGCDIVTSVCRKLDIETETHSALEAIKRELSGQGTP